MNMIRKILAFGLLLSSVLYSAAQADDTEEGKAKTYRATLFNKWEGGELYTKHKKGYSLLEPARKSYTQSFKYKESSIVLFKKGLSEEGEEIYLPALTVSVPPAIIEPLLILAWDSSKEKPVAKVIEFSPRKFPYGSYQIVNLSKLPLGGYIGEKSNKILCKAGKEYITPFALKNAEAAPIVFYTSINNELKKVFGSITIHRNQKRAIYLMNAQTNKLGTVVFQGSVIVDIEKQQK